MIISKSKVPVRSLIIPPIVLGGISIIITIVGGSSWNIGPHGATGFVLIACLFGTLLFGSVVELVAVPASLYAMKHTPALRTPKHIVFTAIGAAMVLAVAAYFGYFAWR
jgi:hypothetical protein